jgi:hypothetical protein
MTNTTTIIRDFSVIRKGFNRLSRNSKVALVNETINTSRYEVLGPVNQFGKMKLRCRFHNCRDSLGRWTSKRK